MPGEDKTLGAVLADLRARNGWTLKEMSQRSVIPVSTLSKIEHGRLSLTYDKLQRLAERLEIRMADLFAEEEEKASAPRAIVGRRSIGTMQSAVRVDTPNYEYNYLCTELRNKRMVPVVTRVHVQSIDDFGELVRHPGEEFIYVVKGCLIVHSEFYDPVQLEEGQSLYIDSGMGHAYVCAPKCKEVLLLGVMSSSEPLSLGMTKAGEGAQAVLKER
jgi:transcriptional regulator with XRE-family HTH domain